MTMNPRVAAAYEQLLDQAISHDTETSHALGALLLNTYNENLSGTGFPSGRFRHLDRENQAAVLTYLEWSGSGPGLYPPSNDMDRLKRIWKDRGWR